MPSYAQPHASLAPNSERQAFLIALAETGNPDVAEQLVIRALDALGNTLPPTAEEINARFFLLLTSGLIDRQWQRRCCPPFLARLLGVPRPDPTPVWAGLQGLSVGLRRAYLLKRLAPLNVIQIASILDLPKERVLHPLWENTRAQAADESKRHYRRQLRTLARALRHLQGALSPSRTQRLRQARQQALESPRDTEHRVLYLWQQAIQRQFLPTGIATLLLLVILLVSWSL